MSEKIMPETPQKLDKQPPRVPVVQEWAFVMPCYDFSTIDRYDPALDPTGEEQYEVWKWKARGSGSWIRHSVHEDEEDALIEAGKIISKAREKLV
jgi:hypothetical protein